MRAYYRLLPEMGYGDEGRRKKDISGDPSSLAQEGAGLLLWGPGIYTCRKDDQPPRSISSDDEFIPIDECLGLYDNKDKKVIIYSKYIEEASEELSCSSNDLEFVVEVHEYTRAVINFGTVNWGVNDKEKGELENIYSSMNDRINETLAQVITLNALSLRKKEMGLDGMDGGDGKINAFIELRKYQPKEYRIHEDMNWVVENPVTGVERVRKTIQMIRKGVEVPYTFWRKALSW